MSVLAAVDPLGPLATVIVATILTSGGVLVVVGYLTFQIRWWLDARRERREHGDRPPSGTDHR